MWCIKGFGIRVLLQTVHGDFGKRYLAWDLRRWYVAIGLLYPLQNLVLNLHGVVGLLLSEPHRVRMAVEAAHPQHCPVLHQVFFVFLLDRPLVVLRLMSHWHCGEVPTGCS